MATKAIMRLNKIETSANSISKLRPIKQSATFTSPAGSKKDSPSLPRTTAKMIVKSSHQNARTIQILVKSRRSRNRITTTRKKVVSPLMGDSQLPSVDPMAPSVSVMAIGSWGGLFALIAILHHHRNRARRPGLEDEKEASRTRTREASKKRVVTLVRRWEGSAGVAPCWRRGTPLDPTVLLESLGRMRVSLHDTSPHIELKHDTNNSYR